MIFIRHHSQGIFECERTFGHTITNSLERVIPVKWIGEQHVQEDLGFIPSLSDWFIQTQPKEWMNKPQKLSKQLDQSERLDLT